MRKMTCYAWGKPGDWEALCVDLDIPAQGESFEQVRDELTAAVEDFLDYVSELPEIERQAVLRRRVPWWLRVQLFCSTDGSPALQYSAQSPETGRWSKWVKPVGPSSWWSSPREIQRH